MKIFFRSSGTRRRFSAELDRVAAMGASAPFYLFLAGALGLGRLRRLGSLLGSLGLRSLLGLRRSTFGLRGLLALRRTRALLAAAARCSRAALAGRGLRRLGSLRGAGLAGARLRARRLGRRRNRLARLERLREARLLERLDGASRLLDLRARGGRELVGHDRELLRELAVAEDLQPVGLLRDEAFGEDRLEIDARAVLEDVERLDVDDRVARSELRVREPLLRQTP